MAGGAWWEWCVCVCACGVRGEGGVFSDSDKQLGAFNSLFLIVSHHGQ